MNASVSLKGRWQAPADEAPQIVNTHGSQDEVNSKIYTPFPIPLSVDYNIIRFYTATKNTFTKVSESTREKIGL